MSRTELEQMEKPVHPYIEFEGSPVWNVVEQAISDLEKNQDLKLTELPEYIVGYICKKLAEEGMLTKKDSE
jgi:hypothetical protein